MAAIFNKVKLSLENIEIIAQITLNMAKLIVHIAFIIYCQAANQNQARNAAPPARAEAAGPVAAAVGA
ncbi:hypothetical protein LOAG_19189, partial [Loa loa]